MTKSPTLIVARPKRAPAILICAKCVRKADEGKAVKKALKAALVERAKAAGQRPGKLVDTKCLGVCPKRAVTLGSGATLARGELLLVGHAADVPAVVEALLGPVRL